MHGFEEKNVCLYKIVSFNDLNHFFLYLLNKNDNSKGKNSVGINTSRRTITKLR